MGIFDDAGYLAGSQSVLPLEHIDSSLVDLSVQPAYQLDMWYDQEAYFATAYFVDPAVICAGGRSSEQWESQGTGDRLIVQVGETPDSLLKIPLTREEADMDPVWYDHYCSIGMGDHYLQFNYQPDQDCFSVLPWQMVLSLTVLQLVLWNSWRTPGCPPCTTTSMTTHGSHFALLSTREIWLDTRNLWEITEALKNYS